jgi:PmbA protein
MSIELSIKSEQLRELALRSLDIARELGATAATCEASESCGLSVTTRKMVVETIENTRDKGIGITVYLAVL